MTLLRKSAHISLVLLLGLYFNSVPIAWLSYSTFAEKTFAAHCVNPGKPSCHGKCQIMAMTEKAEKSSKSQAPTLQISQIQPSLVSSVSLPDLSRVGKKILFFLEMLPVRQGILRSPFHPPRVSV